MVRLSEVAIVQFDDGRNAFAFERFVNGRRGPDLGDERRQIQRRAGQDLLHQVFKFLPLLAIGQKAGAGVGHVKCVQNDAVATRQNFGAENVEARRGQAAGDVG